MSNIDNIDGNVTLTGRTFRNEEDNDSTSLTIPKEFAKELQIENFKVLMSMISVEGNRHLFISKFQR